MSTDEKKLSLAIGLALAGTDPEFFEYFNNFVSLEVAQHSSLDVRTRLMVQLAATIGRSALSQWCLMLRVALTSGVTPVEAKEIVYQAVPYVGVACALDFIASTNEVIKAQGIVLPLPPQSTTNSSTRHEKGLAMQKHILGDDKVDELYKSAPSDLLHIQRYLSANCFGDHYTRNGVDVPMRELLTFSMLAAQGGCDAQVRAHVGMNVNVGNDRQKLIDVATQLLPYIGYPRTLNAITAINEIAPSS
ncbi:hypothetical protein N0V95_005492 [Ascochyta clinopodiicola]|nr:hypothetical protein N0V95_005492 [Ascochyta clinopodiicola]